MCIYLYYFNWKASSHLSDTTKLLFATQIFLLSLGLFFLDEFSIITGVNLVLKLGKLFKVTISIAKLETCLIL